MSFQIYDLDNEKHAKVLRKKTKRVKNGQDTEMTILAQTMGRICLHPGVAGIAANQLGKSVRLFALSQGSGNPPLFFYNPVIKAYSEKTNIQPEGCLSVPGRGGYVERADEITLAWEDALGRKMITENGNLYKYEYTFKGFWAKAVQHEMDHLDGIVYVDHCKGEVFTDEEMQAKLGAAVAGIDEIAAAAEDDMKSTLASMKKGKEPE